MFCFSLFLPRQRAARLMRTPTPVCASLAKGRRMTLIGSCSALMPRHTPPLISCAVSLPSNAHSYSTSLFHTVAQTVSHPWSRPSQIPSYWPHQSDSWNDGRHRSMLFIFFLVYLQFCKNLEKVLPVKCVEIHTCVCISSNLELLRRTSSRYSSFLDGLLQEINRIANQL